MNLSKYRSGHRSRINDFSLVATLSLIKMTEKAARLARVDLHGKFTAQKIILTDTIAVNKIEDLLESYYPKAWNMTLGTYVVSLHLVGKSESEQMSLAESATKLARAQGSSIHVRPLFEQDPIVYHLWCEEDGTTEPEPDLDYFDDFS